MSAQLRPARPEIPFSILHPTDFSQGSRHAFCHALQIAVSYRACLSILHVESDRSKGHRWDEFPGVRATLERWGLLEHNAPKSEVYEQLRLVVEKIDTSGPVVPAIINFLDHHPFDLMVLATHEHQGLPGWLHRSTAQPLARQALLPTLFVPDHARGFVSTQDGNLSLKRLLMPIDHSPSPRRALADAFEILKRLGDAEPELSLMHVGEKRPFIEFPDHFHWQHQFLTVRGDTVESILETCHSIDPDLIVMATAGHQGFMDVIRGSTSERVLRQAPCPVLTIPGDSDTGDSVGRATL